MSLSANPRSLFHKIDWEASARRRRTAGQKMAVYHDRFKPTVERAIRDRTEDQKTAMQISRFATTAANLGKTVTDTVAMGYARGCRRTLKGASKEVAEAFADLVVEVGYDRRCNSLAHYAWWMGPCFVLPSVSETGQASIDIITPDRSDALRRGPEDLLAVVWQRPEDGVFVGVDAKAWRYYDQKGNPLPTDAVMPHGLGVVPAAVFRCEGWEDDWWLESAHAGLYDATIDIAYLVSSMLWARRVQQNKLLVIKGQIENIPPGQSIAHPSQPLYLRGKASEIDVAMHDRTVPIADYVAEINALLQVTVMQYGIPPSEITLVTGEWGTVDIQVRKEKLGALRDLQAPWLRAGERALWPIVVDTVRAARGLHPAASVLPPGDEIRDMLQLDLPDSVDTSEGLKRHDLFEKRLRHGLENPVNLLLEQRPELTPEEAEAIITENLKRWATSTEIAVTRNVSADPAKGAQTIAQIQGAVGGRKRAQNETNDQENTDADR